MGWNQGYTIFEATVMGAYGLGKLDMELLDVLGEPYRDSDIDSGGECGLVAEDGKDLTDVVLSVAGIELPAKPSFPQPETWEGSDADRAWEEYYDRRQDAFDALTRRRWGW